jgi:hypothetical protein
MADIELRYEILRLLRLHGEMGAGTAPTLKDLAQVTGQREREVRKVCAVMEALDYIHGRHSAGGDANPSYEITVEGLVMLHKHEHVYGKSFFDEALGTNPPIPTAGATDLDQDRDATRPVGKSHGKPRGGSTRR